MKKKHVLLSFVGNNDAGKLKGQNDGAILTALSNQKFEEVILLRTATVRKEFDYCLITNYLTEEIINRKLAKNVITLELPINNVIDHNQIYTALKNFTDTLKKDESFTYTAAISSGTPAMQVCWILLAESGDFSERNKLKLVQIKDPKYGKSENLPVKIDTALPKIIRLKEEVESLKKDLIPTANLERESGRLFIGREEIPLAPIEFAYYRYFAERTKSGEELEKFSGLYIPINFIEKIYEYHEESFPVLDINREDLRRMIKSKNELSASTFRGNISKINRKIRESLDNETLTELFQITSEGKRGAKFYGIVAPSEKILISE